MRRLVSTTLREFRRAEIKDKNFRKSESRAFRKAEICIIKMIEKTERQNTDESVKNRFFTEKAKTMNKKKLIIFSENTSFFSTFLFSNSRDSEKMKRAAII